MKVILKDEVDNVGLAGDVVDVADGYGRNFLIPRGFAIIATKGAMKEATALTRSRKVAESKTLGTAEAARETLESRTLRVEARVDERGNLYGSVSAADIQRVLKERGHDIPRKRIEMKGTIKTIGEHEVPVQVHPQVTATITVEVVDEEGLVVPGQAAPEQAPLPIPDGEVAPEATDDAVVEGAATQPIATDETPEQAEERIAAEELEQAAEAERQQAAEAGVDEAGDPASDEPPSET